MLFGYLYGIIFFEKGDTMIYRKLDLKDEFPFLKDYDSDATVEVFINERSKEVENTPKKPAIVICPGGAYGFCSRREAEPIALKYMAMGFNAFVISYSVAPKRYPLQLLEVAALFKYIKQNADEFDCDTDKIAITGFSAGGHLAAHYSNAYNLDVIKENLGCGEKPFATILCYPVISADEKIAHKGSFENLLGFYPDDTEANLCSLERLVTKDTPQTFIWHTAEDGAVPVENSLLYAAALSKYKIPFELHIYPYGGHGLSTVDGVTNAMPLGEKIERASDWLYNIKKWIKITF